MATTRQELDDFLSPLHIDTPRIHSLAKSLCRTYARLAAESQDQFLTTPISDLILKPSGKEKGRYLAIDIGGTNVRVGFLELFGILESKGEDGDGTERPGALRQLEKSWPIGNHLKTNKPDDLFAWIGKCIVEVVQDGCRTWPREIVEEIPLGVSFSFPMIQNTVSDATFKSMGKGFAVASNLDLGKHLLKGYESARGPNLPRVKISAITNDSIATLVSLPYQLGSNPRRKAAMGLIVGTGCNATIPLALKKLHPSKHPRGIIVREDTKADGDLNIIVNTEWTIKGAVGPLRDLDFITKWDSELDSECEAPGFQPFEYMTAGRYLGELGRIMIVDYFTNYLFIPFEWLPPNLKQRHGLSTTFLGNLGPHLSNVEPAMEKQLEVELPPADVPGAFQWTPDSAEIVFRIAKAIQVRAAGMVAAAIIALLACADKIDMFSTSSAPVERIPNREEKHGEDMDELTVGYTGGCIVHFQDYLEDCQRFLDEIMSAEFGVDGEVPKIRLMPCHDGGILGAGILAGMVASIGNIGHGFFEMGHGLH